MVSDAIAGALLKSGLSWLGQIFADWIKVRKLDAQEKKLWNEITSKILDQTKVLFSRYEKTATVAFPRSVVSLESIYVPLTLYPEKSKGKEEYIIDKYPEKLLSKYKKILVIDSAGMGKSTVSKIIFLKAISSKKILPFFIDLRACSRSLKDL